MEREELPRFVQSTAVFLFFIQAVRVLFSVLFGVIYDALFEGPMTAQAVVTNLLVLAAFLAPLFVPRRLARRVLLLTSVLIFMARVPLTVNNPDIRLYSSLLIVAAAGCYAALLLQKEGGLFALALSSALVLDQVARAAGNTWDITLRPAWLPLQVILSVGLLLASAAAWRQTSRQGPGWGIGILGGVALGAFLFLETSLLSLPNALARWSNWSYAALTPALLFVTLLPLIGSVGDFSRVRVSRPMRVAAVLLVCGCLALGSFMSGFAAALALLLAQGLVMFALFSIPRPSGEQRERIGLHLALGHLLFLLINFAYAFSFTYAYTFDFFRGTGLPIVLSAGLLATLPIAWRKHIRQPPPWRKPRLALGTSLLLVALTAVLAFPPPPRMKEAGPNVRLGTYNIHYGYNTVWEFALEGMARTIEESGADFVALQEVDTGRITSYSVDDALWLSRRLRMEVFYLPTVEHLTGIAVLYHFPAQATQGKLLTSRLEQTGVIRTTLNVGGYILDACDIWLGLEPAERMVQLNEALDLITASSAALGGDFNDTPDSAIYQRMIQAGFVDPFIAGGFAPLPTSPSEQPQERIDFVWLRGLQPTAARVLESTASDHRMVVVEARLE